MNDMRLSLHALLVFVVLTGAVFALIGSSAGQAARLRQALAWFPRGHDIGSRTMLIAPSLWFRETDDAVSLHELLFALERIAGRSQTSSAARHEVMNRRHV